MLVWQRVHRRLARQTEALREHLFWWRRGLPHGWDPGVDIDRRLVRTTVRVIVDVGANRGQSARRFRKAFPEASLHCLEPGPSAFAELKRSVGDWPNVFVHQLALGASAGAGSLDDRADDMARVAATGSAEGGASVTIDTLDAFARRAGLATIDYLKIDTEGGDADVLRGGADLLDRSAVAIIDVEVGMNPDNGLHRPMAEILSLLEPRGYRLFGVYEQTLEWPTADAYLRRANLVIVSPKTIRANRWPAAVETT